MAAPEAIFLLIKSLTQGEKALVRQVDKSQAGYIALFDLISKQSQYDERKAKKKLLDQGHDINFAYAKNYLTKHILRTLREHRESAGLDRQVLEITLLMERKVFGLAEKMLQKSLQTALDEERWDNYLKLSQIELELLQSAGGNLDTALARIHAINRQRQQARAALTQLGELEDLYALYRPVVKRKQTARNQWDLQLVEEFAAHPLIAQAAPTSVRARRIHLLCTTLIAAYSSDHQIAHSLIKEALQHYETNPFLLADHPNDYLNELLRLGGYQLHFKDFKAVETTLQTIRDFQHTHSLHGADLFDKYYRLRIALALETKDHLGIQAEWNQIREGLALYRDRLPWVSLSTMLFLMARMQFDQGRLSEARAILEEILQEANQGVREDITSLSRLLLIFIYYQNGSADLAESASKAARKYLQRRDQLFLFEKRILRFLETTSFLAGDRSELPALESLRSDLSTIFQDKLEANVLAFFDILSWLETRIQKVKKG